MSGGKHVTSGASVPKALVSDLLAWLSERGWDDVDEVVTAGVHPDLSCCSALSIGE